MLSLIARVVASASVTVSVLCTPAAAAEPSREAAIRALSSDVMPFDMARTTHVFTKSPSGGVQRVVTKNPGDAAQAVLVRAHLRSIAAQFERRDFAGPTHVHGVEMPGLAALRAAPPDDLRIHYRDVPAGAEIEYFSAKSALVEALHDWFDAQLTDHGADAISGHDHSSMNHPR